MSGNINNAPAVVQASQHCYATVIAVIFTIQLLHDSTVLVAFEGKYMEFKHMNLCLCLLQGDDFQKHHLLYR